MLKLFFILKGVVMKKSFLLFLSLLSTTSLLQAMEEEMREIKPQAQAKFKKSSVFKTLPLGYVGTYNERSNLGSSSGISYPKIPAIHTDEPNIQYSPFGAVFLGNEVTIPPSLKQYLPSKDQFFFLNIQQHDKNGGPLSLKPQYALFPGAPAHSQETQEATVGWTVIPGVEGKIIPEQGETKETLWKETVSTHPKGENDQQLILSSNSMRLQGIELKKSMDCYSFVDGEKASLVTYHWMLTPHDFKKFNRVLKGSDTLNELVYNLDKQGFQPTLLQELKQYVQYQEVEPTLNKPFMSGQSQFQEDYKTLPMGYVKTYNERSNLYSSSGACYPKIPMIHTYEHNVFSPPFGSAFLGNEVAMPLSLKKYLPSKDQFFFLNIQKHEKSESPHSLKPQYGLFPDAPARSNTDQAAHIGWTVIPGVEGEIIPKQGVTNETLWKETVYIHPKGEEPYPDEMVLSGDVMHLQGVDTEKSMDCYSFIDANNASLVTYHWMLTSPDYDKFNQVLRGSNTLNALIYNLGKQGFHPNLLKELKQYVQYQDVQSTLNKPFVSGEQVFSDFELSSSQNILPQLNNERKEQIHKSQKQNSIESLPRNIIAYLLTFLDPYSLLKFSCVSKGMYEISNFNLCWKGRDLEVFNDLKVINEENDRNKKGIKITNEVFEKIKTGPVINKKIDYIEKYNLYIKPHALDIKNYNLRIKGIKELNFKQYAFLNTNDLNMIIERGGFSTDKGHYIYKQPYPMFLENNNGYNYIIFASIKETPYDSANVQYTISIPDYRLEPTTYDFADVYSDGGYYKKVQTGTYKEEVKYLGYFEKLDK